MHRLLRLLLLLLLTIPNLLIVLILLLLHLQGRREQNTVQIWEPKVAVAFIQ